MPEPTHNHDAEIARLRNENEQLRTAIAQLRGETREAWGSAKRAQEYAARTLQSEAERTTIESPAVPLREKPDLMISNLEWGKMGFPKFRTIPPEGKVPLFHTGPSVGDYGGVGLVTVVQVLGLDEMLAEIIHYGAWRDSPLARIEGFSTKGLVDGQHWSGYMRKFISHDYVHAEIAIVGTWSYTTTLGSQKTVLAAIPLDLIRRELTKKQFEELRN
jgi:hypothetical protein